MRPFLSTVLAVLLGIVSTAPSAEGATDVEIKVQDAGSRESDPPGIDYPAAQALGVGTSLYIDHTYESTEDLSTFTWVTGHGSNYRVAAGGNLQLGDLYLTAEIPLQYTRLHIDTLQGAPTIDQDREKASLSLGDIIVGGNLLWDIPVDAFRLRIGAGLRSRLPTHTTQYAFRLASGYIFQFGFPYYLHVSPGIVLVASSKFLTFRVEQALLGMVAIVRDVIFDNIRMDIPDLYFWESHYAVIAKPIEWLGLSAELVSCIQLNRVADGGYTTLHNLKALMLDPAITVDFGGYRASLAGRFGLTHGAQDFGVITFSGTRALLLRLSYVF